MTTLAVVRNIGVASALRTAEDVEDFEQEIVDQYALAMGAAGLTDGYVASTRSGIFEFSRWLTRPLWTATCEDADRFFADQRRAGRAVSTRASKAVTLAQFYEFVIARYSGDVRELTGHVVSQPIDEFNKPPNSLARIRVPPADAEIEEFFAKWRAVLPEVRKYLPAARDYFAASLWRRLGLRINETVMLDMRDWRPDLGELGKLHVRHGKGSHGRGPKARLVPAINGADRLMDWWLCDVRHQFGDDWSDPDAPLIPSERHDRVLTRCGRAGTQSLRRGLTMQTARFLPAWSGRLTPHVLRHYCASSLYGSGMDLKALQELLGHEWLSTTTRYIHVSSDHIEQAWETRTGGLKPASAIGGDPMQWNLRMKAAERGIWKSTQMRRLLADAGLPISAGKMSALWTSTPKTIRLEDLDVICAVLDCDPSALLVPEPEKVATLHPTHEQPAANSARSSQKITPRFSARRSEPPV